MPSSVSGWDIGGAHVKVALTDTGTSVTRVRQLSCPLWRGLDSLRASVLAACREFDSSHSLHAITMTGEMADYFGSRKDGVVQIIGEMENHLHGRALHYFAGAKGFVGIEDAVRAHAEIASANWLASASFVATRIRDAIFIDVGSTTCDVVRIDDHQVIFDGYCDAERLYTRELIYCGVTRTPVFALCREAPVAGRFIPVINEHFAVTADVYRVTGELPHYADVDETPDSRGRDIADSMTRLARMFGYDAETEASLTWRRVSEYVRERQLEMIMDACYRQLAGLRRSPKIVGAGIGRFLVSEIARRLKLQYIGFESLLDHTAKGHGVTAGDCAPAVAVACLAYQRFCA